MNEALSDPIRHNNWATRHLIAFCRDAELTQEQLTTPGAGAYGSILETLNHMVRSDASYLRALLGRSPAWMQDAADMDLDRLAGRAEESELLWEQLLEEPIDVNRVVVVDEGANEVYVGIFVAQALHHGTLHREQVCAMLTSMGVQPPDLQAWEYAWSTGRLWQRAKS